jgi:HEAT repeat protein
MKHLLRKVFGVHPGEGKTILRFASLAVIWAFGSSIAETLAISLFIEKIGATSLPLIYMISSITMIIVSCLFVFLLGKISAARILLGVMTIALIIYAGATILMAMSPPKIFWMLLHIITYAFVSILYACFWTFVDQYHDLQEAKRKYGIYNAFYFLGYILSGSCINIFIHRFGNVVFFASVAITMAISIVLVKNIVNTTPLLDDDAPEEMLVNSKKGIFSILRQLCFSPFAMILVATSIIIELLRSNTEFSYMTTLAEVFNPALSTSSNIITQNAIPEFLGKCKAFIAAGNIIIGTLFYRRLIRRIGLKNMMIIPPLIFFMLYTEWSFHNTLFLAILGVIAVEGVLYSIEDNNFNLLMNAVPSKLQGAIRIINDSFFEPIGMFLSSTFLVFVQSGNRWFGLILSVVFLLCSLCMRSIYYKSIFTNLKQNAIHFERKIKDWLFHLNKKEATEMQNDMLVTLVSDSEDVRMLAFKSIISSDNEMKFIDEITHSLDSFCDNNKVKIIKHIEHSNYVNDARITEKIIDWNDITSSDELIKRSNLFLAKRGLLHPEKIMDDLDSPDIFKRAAAIITLKKSLANQSLKKAGLNRTIGVKELDLLLLSDDIEEILMGLEILSEETGPYAVEKTISLLSHPILSLKRAAAKTLIKISDKASIRHTTAIIHAIETNSDNLFRISCLKALGNIGDSTTVRPIITASNLFRPNERRVIEEIIIKNMGLKTVPVLLSITKDVKLPERSRILASKILGRLALPQLRANLSDIISIEIERAYFYFYYGNTIQKRYPLYDLSLLENALLTVLQSVIDFIIHLLSAAGSIEDCDIILMSLHGKNYKARADAVEMVEKNCDVKIFKKILPLIDVIPKESVIEEYRRFFPNTSTLSLMQLLNKLEKSFSLHDKTIAAHLKAKLKMPNWKKSLREQIKSCDGPFHQYAYELLES